MNDGYLYGPVIFMGVTFMDEMVGTWMIPPSQITWAMGESQINAAKVAAHGHPWTTVQLASYHGRMVHVNHNLLGLEQPRLVFTAPGE